MSGTKKQLRFSDFGITEETGFLPLNPPLRRLPGEYFSSWEDTCARISMLIKDKHLRAEIESLPERQFNEDTLKCEEEWQRAYVLLTYLSQAYIWAEGEAGVVEKLPKKLAIPWYSVSEHVSLQPVASYGAVVLYNYGLHDRNGEMIDDNLTATTTFTGTEDESWFYMVHALVELAAIPAIKGLEHSFKAIEEMQNKQLASDLELIGNSLLSMRDCLKRMSERCNPLIYYVHIRPFQSGSKEIKAFPNGIVFEGVDAKPKQYHGSSAGQSATISMFDVYFRAKHTGPEQEFLQTMRDYMPKRHREFLEVLESLPSVRDYVLYSKDAELVKSYNMAVEAFGKFRSEHIILATKFIVMQKKHSVSASLELTGTGGTPFMKFLKQVRDDTVALKISLSN